MKEQVADFLGLNNLQTSVAILDPSGTIVAVNSVWKSFGRRNGLRIPHSAIGADYLQYCQSDEPELREFAKSLKALLQGRGEILTLVYPCHSPAQNRWFVLLAVPLSSGEAAGVAILHVNITQFLLSSFDTYLQQGMSWTKNNNHGAINKNSISKALKHTVRAMLSEQPTIKVSPSRRRLPLRSTPERRITENGLSAHARLTKSQLEVLALLGEGKSNKEIASILTRSPNTVKLHVSAILRRLELKSRTEAAIFSSMAAQ